MVLVGYRSSLRLLSDLLFPKHDLLLMYVHPVTCPGPPPLRLQESLEPGRASTYRSLVTNTSKEMMCFSDFPMPADYPNYLHHAQLLGYLRLYVQHFDLLRHIRFQVATRSEEPPTAVRSVSTFACFRRR